MSARVTLLLYNPFRHDARVRRHAAALAGAGHDVRVVATRDSGLPERDAVAGFEVVRVDHDPSSARLARRLIAMRRDEPVGIGGVIDQHTLKPGGGWRTLPARAALGLHLALAWLRFRRQALRAVADGADVWIANDLDTLPLAVAARRRHGGRILYDAHELYVEHVGNRPKSDVTRRLQGWLEQRLIRTVDGTVTVNESIAQELERRYGVGRPGVVMNVPDRPAGHPARDDGRLRRALGVEEGRPIALYVGGIGVGRGVEELVRAASHLDGATIALMGPLADGYRAELESLAGSSAPEGTVRFLAPVHESEVLDWTAGADVGVVPYRNTCLNNYLSLPNKLFEYLGAGVPVVVSDFPELRRVVQEHDVGATCDPDDPVDIARAIRAVVGDPGRHAALRASAARAGECFTWDRERSRFLEAVQGVLSPPRARPEEARPAPGAAPPR